MTKLILTRHGETSWNLEGRVQGAKDSPLTQKGILQARQLAYRLRSEGIKYLYSSDMPRAHATAEEIRRVLNILEVRLTPAMRELCFGEWEGQVWWELRKNFPEIFTIWDKGPHLVKIPGAESMNQVTERAWAFVQEIIGKHKGETVCIVTHGMTLQLLVKKIMGFAVGDWESVPWQHNTALNIFEVNQAGDFQTLTVADHTHLCELGT
ncbi:MAG: histidine phosphatase family protein [Desulfitobacterium hafniense]|nr:histidine phosphatase family protein [Desulfitobacterium hafniense]